VTIVEQIVGWLNYSLAFYRKWLKSILAFTFRATFATELKESGMTSSNVADLMGHADTRMVDTVYARTRHEGIMKQKSAIEALNSRYAKQASEVQ